MSTTYDGTSPLLLEMTADSNTQMICDALNGCGSVARGGALTAAAGFDFSTFKLTTIIPAVGSTGTVDAQITPFTHIAAKKIQASSDASSANISAVTSKINQLVGVNIVDTQPVNIADSTELGGAEVAQQRYTLMLAALAEQLFEDSDGNNTSGPDDLVANLEAIANDFATDDDFGDADGLRIDDLLTAVNTEVSNAGAELGDEVKTALTQHTTIISAQSEGGSFKPEATTGEGSDDVARAKALVAEVRTLSRELESLESPADAFLNDADVILDMLDQSSQDVIEVFTMAADAVVAAIDTSNGAVPSIVSVYDGDGQVVGTVNVTNNSGDADQQYTMSAASLDGVAVDATIKLNAKLDENLEETAQAADLVATINGSASNAESKVTLSETNFTIRLKDDADSTGSDGDDDEPAALSTIALAGGIVIEELVSGVATGKKASANTDIKLVELNTSGDGNLTLEKISLTDLMVGDASGQSVGLSISLEIDNAANFDVLSGQEETAENFLDATLTITGKIDLADKPEAMLTLTADKTGLEAGSFTAKLGYDNKSMEFVANTTNGEAGGTSGNLTFTNADGVSMTVNASSADATSGSVSVGDQVVGVMEELGNGALVIRYNDGTFESL